MLIKIWRINRLYASLVGSTHIHLEGLLPRHLHGEEFIQVLLPLHSEFNYETWQQKTLVEYAYLFPLDYKKPVSAKTDPYFNPGLKTTFITYNTFNADAFWKVRTEE